MAQGRRRKWGQRYSQIPHRQGGIQIFSLGLFRGIYLFRHVFLYQLFVNFLVSKRKLFFFMHIFILVNSISNCWQTSLSGNAFANDQLWLFNFATKYFKVLVDSGLIEKYFKVMVLNFQLNAFFVRSIFKQQRGLNCHKSLEKNVN